MQRSQPERAVAAAVRAVRFAPGEVAHRLQLARLLLAVGQRDEAVRIARDAVTLARTPQDQAALQQIIQASAATR